MSELSDQLDGVGAAYLERLTDADLHALVRADRSAAASDVRARIAALRREPALVLDVLDRPATSAAILNLASARSNELAFVSPFLVFAAAIHRTAADLAATTYTPERTTPRLRVPVFDALQLAAYLAAPQHRLFLADLLTSFARISSGVTVTRTPDGVRRRRWNDLDPAALAGLLAAVPVDQRPAVWRRLGDLALFLVGVFPDAAEQVAANRLAALRLAQLTGLGPHDVPDTSGPELLEWLGAGWYRLAARGARATPLAELAADFHPARRVLNAATDRYLLPVQSSWFAPPGR
jgi:hypothetical protein